MAETERNAVEAKLKEAKNTVKKIRDKEEIEKFVANERAKRDADRAKDSAIAQDRLLQNQTTKGERGEQHSRAEEVTYRAEKALKADISAFNDLRNAVMSIMNDNYELCKYLHYSSKKSWGPAVQEAKNWVKEKIEIMSNDDAGTWKANHPKVELPNLEFESHFEEGKPVTFTVKREDGGDLEPSVAKNFSDMIAIWFNTKTANAPLTKEFIEAHKAEFCADFSHIMENDIEASLKISEKESENHVPVLR